MSNGWLDWGALPYQVDTGTGCWLWLRGHSSTGYGTVYIDRKSYGAHVASWELVHGPVPKGFIVHHKCAVRLCVNPEHLELLTRSQHHKLHLDKPYCPNGHPYTPENIYYRPNGHKYCRECHRIAERGKYVSRI